jgi:hypothetical protein
MAAVVVAHEARSEAISATVAFALLQIRDRRGGTRAAVRAVRGVRGVREG